MELLTLSLSPIIAILFYVYCRDKYEKEPVSILLKCFFSGALVSMPILMVESLLAGGWRLCGFPTDGLAHAAYTSFVVAGFSEELFKFITLIILIWMSREFNERFDGIVYSVFVSLGFAAVENVVYVFNGGASVGIARMYTAVPVHAVLGITMGYYFALAKFVPEKRGLYLNLAIILPIAIHGFYNFIIFSKIPLLLLLFTPYLGVLFFRSNAFMNAHSDNSAFALGKIQADFSSIGEKEKL